MFTDDNGVNPVLLDIRHNITLTGTASAPMTIDTDDSTTPWELHLDTGATANLSYLNLDHLQADSPIVCHHCTDGGHNNANVIFPTAKTWTGDTDTDWTNPDNWSPAGVPTAYDDVDIPNASNKPSLIDWNGDGVSESVGSLTLEPNAKITDMDDQSTIFTVTGISPSGQARPFPLSTSAALTSTF